MRADTLCSLNGLGRDLRVEFDPDLLHMSESGHDADVVASKIEGLRALPEPVTGPIAVVDHEPAVICSMVEADNAERHPLPPDADDARSPGGSAEPAPLPVGTST